MRSSRLSASSALLCFVQLWACILRILLYAQITQTKAHCQKGRGYHHPIIVIISIIIILSDVKFNFPGLQAQKRAKHCQTIAKQHHHHHHQHHHCHHFVWCCRILTIFCTSASIMEFLIQISNEILSDFDDILRISIYNGVLNPNQLSRIGSNSKFDTLIPALIIIITSSSSSSSLSSSSSSHHITPSSSSCSST